MPGRKKPGPPPMMSRESSKKFGKPWACAWPAPANTTTAANRKAKARVIFFLVKKSEYADRDRPQLRRSYNQRPRDPSHFRTPRLKKATCLRRWLHCSAKPLTKRVNND